MNSTQITIAGHTADAPELRYTTTGKAVVKMRVAVNGRHQDASGQWNDGPTSWHTVIAWNKLAENVAASVAKGDRLVVHGRLEQQSYQTDAGERRTTWEITADEIGISLQHATARPEKVTNARPELAPVN